MVIPRCSLKVCEAHVYATGSREPSGLPRCVIGVLNQDRKISGIQSRDARNSNAALVRRCTPFICPLSSDGPSESGAPPNPPDPGILTIAPCTGWPFCASTTVIVVVPELMVEEARLCWATEGKNEYEQPRSPPSGYGASFNSTVN